MSQSADLIITNARVFTSDESNPGAEAVAVKGNRIIYGGQIMERNHSRTKQHA